MQSQFPLAVQRKAPKGNLEGIARNFTMELLRNKVGTWKEEKKKKPPQVPRSCFE